MLFCLLLSTQLNREQYNAVFPQLTKCISKPCLLLPLTPMGNHHKIYKFQLMIVQRGREIKNQPQESVFNSNPYPQTGAVSTSFLFFCSTILYQSFPTLPRLQLSEAP